MLTSKKITILIYLSLILYSCVDTSNDIDKNTLWYYDYRLFQSTPAWELAKSVQDGNENEIDKILAEKPDLVDFQESNHGMTLLMMTILNQRKATFPYSMICANQQCGLSLNKSQWRSFRCLLNNGASVNVINKYGDSPLMIACSCDYYDQAYVRELINHGADVNYSYPDSITSRSGNATPLLNAVRCHNFDIVKLLVEHRADINYVDKYNNTALGLSMSDSDYGITLFLLEKGADYNIPVSEKSFHTHKNDTSRLRIEEELRYHAWPLGSRKHLLKMRIVDFLKKKEIDYKKVKIPNDIVEYAKEEYPSNWEYYLENY